MAGKAVVVTDSTFEAEVLKATSPVLVDFWATWCGPCRMVGPVVEELATEYEGKVKVCKLDVDENGQTAGKFGITAVPTLMIFKDGVMAQRVVGVRPKKELKALLDEQLKG